MGQLINHFKKTRLLVQNHESIEKLSPHIGRFRNESHYQIMLLSSFIQARHPQFPSCYLKLKRYSFGVNINSIENKAQSSDKKMQKTMAMLTCELGTAEMVEAILADVNFTSFDSENNNLLFYALKNQDQEENVRICELILQCYPKLTIAPHIYRCLELAVCQRQSVELVKVLFKNQVDPNLKNLFSGNTVIMESVPSFVDQDIFKAMLEVFLDWGLDRNIKNIEEEDLTHIIKKYFEISMEDILLGKKKKSQSEQKIQQIEDIIILPKKKSKTEGQQCLQDRQKQDQLEKICELLTKPKNNLQGEHLETNEIELNYSLEQDDEKLKCFGSKTEFSEEIYSHAATKDEDFNSEAYFDETSLMTKLEQQDSQSSEEGLEENRGFDYYIYEVLSEDIKKYCHQCEREIKYAWEDIKALFGWLTRVGDEMHLSIDVIGSYATGIWTSDSDIDIVYMKRGNSASVDSVLNELFRRLQKNSERYRILKLYLNRDLKVPNISLTLSGRTKKRKLDIVVFQHNNNGQKYVNFVSKELAINPFIKPVFYVMKRLLKNWKLNNPSKGGIKTYALFLMIRFALQRYPAGCQGQALINLIVFYACEYLPKQLSVEGDDVVVKLHIYDPLNVKNNVGGKQTNTEKLLQMFKTLNYHIWLTPNNLLSYLFHCQKMFDE